MSFTSYAQNYEDVMLIRALRGIEHGFYIDVGAQDPVDDSVTKAFYELGWRGINIEPVTHWFHRLVADRPHDINLQIAVSDSPGQLHLFEVEASGLSTTDPEFAARHTQAGHQIRESDVECVTLDEICDTHRSGEVHFLKIDCEGGETAALRGLSLDRIRPWIILIEATEPNSQKPAYAEWEPLLTGRGYHFVYEDGLNRFYVADERSELDPAFSHPPNVFDYFVRASEAAARAHLQVAEGDLSALRDAQRLAQLESECEHLRIGAEFLNSENERREAALVEHRRLVSEAAEREARSAERAQVEREQWRAESERCEEISRKMMSDAHERISELSERLDRERTVRRILGRQYRSAQESVDLLRKQLGSVELERSSFNEQLKALQAERLDLNEHVAELIDSVANSHSTHSEFFRDLQNAQAVIGEKVAACEQLQAKLHELQASHAHATDELLRLRAELTRSQEHGKTLQSLLIEVQATRSWRMTAPLRRLRRGYRQGAQASRFAMVKIVRIAVRTMARVPGMRLIGRHIVGRSPQIKNRLVRLGWGQPTPSSVPRSAIGSATAESNGGQEMLSRSAQEALVLLKEFRSGHDGSRKDP
ncbi:MAG: FkbM family methyltransferase [Rhodanobacter sp.]|jgi:FkbM family methyltransferase